MYSPDEFDFQCALCLRLLLYTAPFANRFSNAHKMKLADSSWSVMHLSQMYVLSLSCVAWVTFMMYISALIYIVKLILSVYIFHCTIELSILIILAKPFGRRRILRFLDRCF